MNEASSLELVFGGIVLFIVGLIVFFITLKISNMLIPKQSDKITFNLAQSRVRGMVAVLGFGGAAMTGWIGIQMIISVIIKRLS